jgi:hypothetical protein
MKIKDLIRPVIGKLRQRTDMIDVIPYYIAQSLLDLTENIEFEGLKVTGPLANFVPNIAEYPISGYDINGITGNPFIQSTDVKLTFIQSWFVYFNTNGQITPGQNTGKEIDARALRVVEPMSKILGIPSVYVLFGNKRVGGKIIVGQMPDNPYACQMRYQKQHPFNIPFAQVMQAQYDPSLANMLASSEVYIDDDWSEIVILSAAEKVCDDIGMNEIGAQYHQKLFGYKDKRGNDYPGLITVRQTQQERSTPFNSRALRPYVRRYTG